MPSNNEKYFLFLDESGTPTLKEGYKSFNERYFGISGAIISGLELQKLEEKMNLLKSRSFNSEKTVLHRSGENKNYRNIPIKRTKNLR